jgi:hypothetical protein
MHLAKKCVLFEKDDMLIEYGYRQNARKGWKDGLPLLFQQFKWLYIHNTELSSDYRLMPNLQDLGPMFQQNSAHVQPRTNPQVRSCVL